jgi:hypothetical protein
VPRSLDHGAAGRSGGVGKVGTINPARGRKSRQAKLSLDLIALAMKYMNESMAAFEGKASEFRSNLQPR